MSFLIESSDEFLCRAYGTAEEALEAFAEMPPDVVLMDINLPAWMVCCSRIIKEKYPSVHIMMCTVYEDDEKIFRALSAGAVDIF